MIGRVVVALVAAAVVASPFVVHAGPAEGEMFGYRLGDVYPLTKNSQFTRTNGGHWFIVAERPEAPAAFQLVEVAATPMSRRITAINGYARAATDQAGYALSAKYATLLRDKLQARCPEKRVRDYDLWMECPGVLVTVKYEREKRHAWIHTDVLRPSELRATEQAEVSAYMAQREKERLDSIREDKDANRGL